MNIYNREDVYKTTLDYFNGDTLAADVWVNKYALKDSIEGVTVYYEKTPDDMHRRIAKEFSRIENKYENPLTEDEIFDYIKNFEYIIPQGSPMAGIGNDRQVVSLSNCFVIGSDHDSYGSICLTDEEQIQLMKRRGGVGHDLSHIRPDGSPVKNSALTSTGIVPFMERYSNSTKEVAQGGRRGALMLSVSIAHPDSESFINAKLEAGKVTGANISVKITDEFMTAALNSKTFIQQYPIISDNPLYKKEINAKELWGKIVHNAWKSAEPGILFWDTVKREAVPDCYKEFGFNTVSTNPCFSGKEKLLTINGYETFEELCGLENIEIFNCVGNVVPTKVWYSGKKETVKIYDSQCKITTCTPDHVWKTINDGEVQSKDLKGKKLLPYLYRNTHEEDLYVKLGFIQGDGNLSRLKSTTHKGFEINIGKNDDDVLKYFNLKRTKKNQRSFYLNDYFDICKSYEFSSENLPERVLPLAIHTWSKSNKLSFLCGLFSANGSIVGNYRVTLKSTCKLLILETQKLLKEFEIDSYYTTNKSKSVKFDNGNYICKESYDLNIGKYYDLINFYMNIGFIHQYKNDKLYNVIISRSPKITKVIKGDIVDVYDFSEPETNWGVVNGCISHNCGEIPLCPYDSCRLLAINLYSFVIDPFTKDARFDRVKFKKVVEVAERFMDDIVDLEKEKIVKILEKIEKDPEPELIKRVERELWIKIMDMTEKGRRTGLGVTAEGDMLAALGLIYGTPEATKFSTEMHKDFALFAYKSSAIMAKERGPFPIYDYKREESNPFIKRLIDLDPELGEMMKKTGRRNISCLTIAPTGSVSILTQTTSGVEPAYLVSYKRRRKINPTDKGRVDYIDDEGIKWEEYNVFHHKFETWLGINGYNIDEVKLLKESELKEIIEKSPYHKATSNDVDWVEKVKMQGAIQKFVDHSISVTVNLPNSITEDVVSKVYEAGWKSGCKGITVYRDGSRQGVIMSNEGTTSNVILEKENNAKPRPKRLECEIVRFSNNKEKWIGFLGIMTDGDDKYPYEIFTGLADSFIIPPYVEKGEIIKIKDETGIKRYDFTYKDKDGYTQTMTGLNRAFDREFWNMSKLISAFLRHRIHLPSTINIIDSLKMTNDAEEAAFGTWKSGIKRILKKYIKDSNPASGVCPVCKSTNIIYRSGCKECQDCSWSACE